MDKVTIHGLTMHKTAFTVQGLGNICFQKQHNAFICGVLIDRKFKYITSCPHSLSVTIQKLLKKSSSSVI